MLTGLYCLKNASVENAELKEMLRKSGNIQIKIIKLERERNN